jgi:hypothetical protein
MYSMYSLYSMYSMYTVCSTCRLNVAGVGGRLDCITVAGRPIGHKLRTTQEFRTLRSATPFNFLKL